MFSKSLGEITMKDILDISCSDSYLGKHLRLKKQGPNYFGLCIFHREKHPSFYIRPLKDDFVCYGCGVRGGPLIFLTYLAKSAPFDFVRDKLRYFVQDFEMDQFEEALLREQKRFGLGRLFNVHVIS